MTDAAHFRADLVAQLEVSAEWRAGKAVEYPDDHRNTTSRIALEVAARDIAALPVDDPRLLHLAEFVTSDRDISTYVEEESRLIGRHGFGAGSTQTTSELLNALVVVAWQVAD